jgi:hypothetical protein
MVVHGVNPTKEIVIVQTYKDGTVCEATGMPRTAKVYLKCCTEHQKHILSEQRQQLTDSSSSASASDKMLLIHVKEDEDNLCTYVADVCTPFLCPTSANLLPSSDRSVLSSNTRESIGMILRRTLETLCLQRTDGWWRYEFCHFKHTRQFHVGTTLDPSTGVAVVKIETDHKLGLYTLVEDNNNNNIGPTSDNNSPTTTTTNNNKDNEEDEMRHLENESTADAVYVMEYTNGDMCDNSPDDIKDHSIKSVARATTVKFSCGKNYELVRIEEDRTCHYVFHVTIPELCRHPWFQVPVVKEQVIKCLPVSSEFLL